jgi:two-component system cell cycle sensor histidine kinase/response regulator CckA
MPRERRTAESAARSTPFLRLFVVGAGLLVGASMLPLAWRATHTLKACMTVTASYLKGESLRDFVFHLNDVLAHDAVSVVYQPERLDRENRALIADQLHDKLMIAKFARQACHAKCALDRADSLQAVLRAGEAAAIGLAIGGRQAEAMARLQDPVHRRTMQEFMAALDEYARDFQQDVDAAVAAERVEERAALVWVALILAISVSLWFVLLRSVERWRRRVLDEVKERETARRELTESLRRYSNLLDQVHEAVLLVDPATRRILEVNPAAAELLGFEIRELLATSMDRIEVGVALSQDDAREGAVVECEYRCRGGEILRVEVSRRRVIDRGRELLLCLARDVTERRELEARLVQAQQMECVGRVAAGIAHDLGNTLLALSAQASVLRRIATASGRDSGGLVCIEAALERATAVIGSLLAIANGSAANPRRFDAVRLVKECLDVAEAILPARVRLMVAPLPACALWIHADPDRLHQALLNLVLNARDAMPEGGTLRLDVRTAAGAPGEEPGRVEIAVTDDGVGMSAAIRDRVGEPFLTSKAGSGVGLGLYNVTRVLEECGGRLEVASREGEGSTFQISLPLAAAQGDRTPVSAATPGRIIVAMSDEYARELIVEALRAEGHGVVRAADCEQLQACAQWRAAALAIVDSELDDGRGVDCVARMQRRGDAPPVLLLLGRPWREVEGRIAEVTSVLVKPYTISALRRLMEAAMATTRPGKEALT